MKMTASPGTVQVNPFIMAVLYFMIQCRSNFMITNYDIQSTLVISKLKGPSETL